VWPPKCHSAGIIKFGLRRPACTMLDVFYSDHVAIPLPAKHHFPQQKYRLLRERLAPHERAGRLRLIQAEAVDHDDLLRVHTPDYISRVLAGELTDRQQRELGFPWSSDYSQRTLLSCGATVAAALRGVECGVALHTAGGTHHAFADRPAGFCVFNDAMVAIRRLQHNGKIARALIVDCDVHHGDGTATLAAGDDTIFTLSLHGAHNYPRIKPASDIDVPLPDATDDTTYLAALDDALDRAWPHCGECVFYLAGADPYVGDKYGRMALTKAGLAERDRRVFARCRDSHVPVVVMMAGGYARDVADTVDIHQQTVELACDLAAEWCA
jgi:acetoin utilization deacetylase AcuC-like enzyme